MSVRKREYNDPKTKKAVWGHDFTHQKRRHREAGLPSFTAFAIRICSLLTGRLVSCQSMAFHDLASSMRAPVL